MEPPNGWTAGRLDVAVPQWAGASSGKPPIMGSTASNGPGPGPGRQRDSRVAGDAIELSTD